MKTSGIKLAIISIILLINTNCDNASSKSLKENIEGSYSREEEDEKIKNTYVLKIEFISTDLYRVQVKVFSLIKKDNEITEVNLANEIFNYNDEKGVLEIKEKGKEVELSFSDGYKKLNMNTGEKQGEFTKQ